MFANSIRQNSGNPFAQLLTTFTTHYLYGRHNQVAAITKEVIEGKPKSQIVVGVRKIGKTALLQHVRDVLNASRGTTIVQPIAIYVPLKYEFSVKSKTEPQEPSSVLRTLLLYLYWEVSALPQANARQSPPLPTLSQLSHLSITNLRDALVALLEWLREQQFRVIFLLDDLQEAIRQRFEPDTEASLKELTDFASFVITMNYLEFTSLFEFIPAAFLPADSNLLNTLRHEGLPLLSDDVARALIQLKEPDEGVKGPLSNGKANSQVHMETLAPPSLELAEVDMLFNIAGPHPYALTLVCAEYLNYRSLIDEPTRAALVVAKPHQLQVFIRYLMSRPEIAYFLGLCWAAADSADERQLLDALAHDTTLAFAARLYQWQTGNAENVGPEKRLEEKRLIYQVGGKWLITGEIFRQYILDVYPRWARQLQPSVEQMRDYIATSLGGTDQRVFNYLTAHADVLCPYVDIMDSVWGNRDSIRALNASVTRLRNALAQLVTSDHEYIINERSRGYRFSSRPPVE